MIERAVQSMRKLLLGCNSLWAYHIIAITKTFSEISNFVCSFHSLGSFGSLGQISLFLDPIPPGCFYVGYLNLFWYLLGWNVVDREKCSAVGEGYPQETRLQAPKRLC